LRIIKVIRERNKYRRFLIKLYICDCMYEIFDKKNYSLEKRFNIVNKICWEYRFSNYYDRNNSYKTIKRFLKRNGYIKL
jgi:hypothetical protein